MTENSERSHHFSDPKVYLFLGFGPISFRIITKLINAENPVIHLITERPVDSNFPINVRVWRNSEIELLCKTTHFDIVVNSWRSLSETEFFNRKHLLNDLALNNPRRLLFINLSTVAIYGGQADFHTEASTANPINQYGIEKLEIENFLKKVRGVQVQNLRISNVFGDIDLKDVVNGIVKAKMNKTKIVLTEPRKVFRDFIHIDDVVEVIYRIIHASPNIGFDIINIARGKSVSLLELVETCERIFEEEIVYSEMRLKSNEIQVSKVSTKKMQSRFQLTLESLPKQLHSYIGELKQKVT